MTPSSLAYQPRPPGLSVEPLLQPRSIAVVGVAPEPAVGGRVLANLGRFAFAGDVHLVSRTRTEVDGRPCLATIDELPMHVDLAVLTIPGGAVLEAIQACARRGVRAAVVYASGFAEMGEEGKALQAEIARVAREADIALLGPNCIGLTNYVDGVPLSFGVQHPRSVAAPAIAVVGQSGGMVGAIRLACDAKGLQCAYTISTGNEAVLSVEDFLDPLLDDVATRVIAVFVEQIRRPGRFLALARKARSLGKPIVLLHPGRSAAARDAAQSHTGAVASDHAVMRTLVQREGVLVVETMETMVDVMEILCRFPEVPAAGTVVMSDSGAFKGLAADFADSVKLELPPLSEATGSALDAVLPDFASASNPLDISSQVLSQPDLVGKAAAAVLADPAVGSLIISIMPGSVQIGLTIGKATLPFVAGAAKPVLYVLMGGDSPVAPELVSMLREAGVVFLRSPERAMRAMAAVNDYGRTLRLARSEQRPRPTTHLDAPGDGLLAEHVGKAFLAKAGLTVPAGGLARTVDEACAIASRVGYPVVIKAQAADLPHKSDAGGVRLNLTDEAGLRSAWTSMLADVAAARPDLVLDGVLVEAMAERGLELIVAARRDPDWGPVLMAGLGGVWIEALEDVKLIAPDLSEAAIEAELRTLKGARLLDAFRGAPAPDVAAVARVLRTLGDLLAAAPEVREIEINPLVAYPAGRGAVVLDALVTGRG